MSELPKKIHDDKNGLDYTLCGDYCLPDLGVEPGYLLGKYDMVRMAYSFVGSLSHSPPHEDSIPAAE